MIEEIKEDNNCIIKAFENNPISILQEDINNKKVYYFKASDVAKVLDISQIRSSIQNYDSDEKVVRKVNDLRGCEQDTTFLTSQGVYRLLYNSKKDIAKKFRKWVGNILDDIIFNNSQELKKQLQENKQLLIEQKKKNEQYQLQLEEKEKQQMIEKHYFLIEKFKEKRCIYLCKVGDNLIKIGSSKNIETRKENLQKVFGSCLFLDVFECFEFREIEENILSNVRDYLYKDKINEHISKEVVLLNEQFNYKQLVSLVKNEIKNYINKGTEIEYKKYNLIEKLLDKNFNFEQINTLINKQLTYQQENNNQEETREETQQESNRCTKGKRIQMIDPDNLSCIVKIYNCMMEVLQDNPSCNKHSILYAIKHNTVYNGYRWLFVEHTENHLIVNHIEPTVKSHRIINSINKCILELNKEKTHIIETYRGITQLKNKLKLNIKKVHKIIDEKLIYNNSYYVHYEDCPTELLPTDNNSLLLTKNPKSKSIKQINVITKEEIIYTSMQDACSKCHTTHKTLKNVIQNKKTLNGYLWEYT